MFKKFDGGKPMVSLVEPNYTLGVARVLTFGAEKYGKNNWKEATEEDIQRYKDALYRHWLAYLDGEEIDPESGLPHLDHIGCNTMFLRYFDAKQYVTATEVRKAMSGQAICEEELSNCYAEPEDAPCETE